MLLKVKKFSEDAVIPSYAHEGDAGMDLSSIDEVTILPGGRALIDTGIGIEMWEGYVGLVHPRSGLAHKHGITILNAPGTVDWGYRGSIKINLINHGIQPFKVNVGDRIAQLVVQKYSYCHVEIVEYFGPTGRGADGHGSTGVA